VDDGVGAGDRRVAEAHFHHELPALAEEADVQVLRGQADVVEVAEDALVGRHLGHRAVVGGVPGVVLVLVALFVTLIPTTIGALPSLIIVKNVVWRAGWSGP
jgi:hypothetical protein